jgi:ribosomal protein L7/L12
LDQEYIKVINDALENDELVYMVRDLKQNKLQAVKNVKETLGIGLKHAKDIIDKIFEIYK